MEPQAWIMIILFVLGGLAGLLLWVLNGIKANQANIWKWAREAVADLKHDVARDREKHEVRLMDYNRYARHSIRTIYSELLELARNCPNGEGVAKSIEKTMREGL